jgi:putative PIN family toxin of toxin-antitoxin system
LRVLLDVNILVRANEKSQGPARALLLGLIGRKHVVLTSAEILIELARVLRYPRMQALFSLSEAQIYDYVQFLKDVCEVVPGDELLNVPIRDAADAVILRAAATGEADVICTLDADFYTVETTAFCATIGIEVRTDVDLKKDLGL